MRGALPPSPLTLSPPLVFDVGAGVCDCLCARMPARAGAVTPRSAVAPKTRRAASGSHHRGKAGSIFFCVAVKVIVGSEGCIANGGGSAPHTVATTCFTSPPLVFDVCAGVCDCLCARMPVCARACVRGSSSAAVGGGYGNTAAS